MLTSEAQFLVDDLTEIEWNDAAFDHLVLPGNEKELAWAFVENKALSTNHFDDFVQDKGTCLVPLPHPSRTVDIFQVEASSS